MAYVDEHGVAVMPARPISPGDAAILQSQDITIVHLRNRNVSWRAIGKFLNMSHEGVRLRFNRIPAEAREYYRRMPVLGGAN